MANLHRPLLILPFPRKPAPTPEPSPGPFGESQSGSLVEIPLERCSSYPGAQDVSSPSRASGSRRSGSGSLCSLGEGTATATTTLNKSAFKAQSRSARAPSQVSAGTAAGSILLVYRFLAGLSFLHHLSFVSVCGCFAPISLFKCIQLNSIHFHLF